MGANTWEGVSWPLPPDSQAQPLAQRRLSRNKWTIKCNAYDGVEFGFFFFNVDHFLKSSLNLLQYCFCFMFCFFGHKTRGIFAPRSGIEPVPPAPCSGM